MTWQPIETAPKDTAVLLGCFSAPDGLDLLCDCIMVGEWRQDCWVVSMGLSARGMTVMASMLMPWTHWMPLPDPPA